MSLRIETVSLSKSFGDFQALNAVSLEFAPGRIHSLLGENGAGKSTFLKLLFGLLVPSSGEIRVDGQPVRWTSPVDAIRLGLGMVQQHFTLIETLSVIDNILLGAEVCTRGGVLNRKAAIRHLEKILPDRSLAVPWYALVSSLSVGQKQRVEILKLLFREAKVLFLDEPTAVLTPVEIGEFFAILKTLQRQGRTIVLITHKVSEVLEYCDMYCVLRQGRVEAQGEVAATTAEALVECMIGRKILPLTIARPPPRTDIAVSIHNLVLKAGQIGVSMRLQRGEIVGIAGVEGAGQSQLVEALMGLEDFSGSLKLFGEPVKPLHTRRVRDLGTALIPEDRHLQGLWLEESCSINMIVGLEDKYIEHGLLQKQRIVQTTEAWAREFDVRASSLETLVGALSGGNQQKVLFAREVAGRKPRLLICHQPSRGVDLGAIDLIHRKLLELRNQGLAVLILSSELDELLKLSDRIYVLFEGQVRAEIGRDDFDLSRIGAAMTGVPLG